jgi:hypothetical protein
MLCMLMRARGSAMIRLNGTAAPKVFHKDRGCTITDSIDLLLPVVCDSDTILFLKTFP